MNYKVSSAEVFYLNVMRVIGAAMYVGLAYSVYAFPQARPMFGVLGFYASIIIVAVIFGSISLLGGLRGNAVRISEKQFPDVFKVLAEQSQALGLKTVPVMYVVQAGGALNAFAIRLFKINHVVLFADVFELAYKDGMDAVSFIIGHELGHLKRNHVGFLKNILILPARLVPFLGSAYSRACESNSDNIGYALAPRGAKNGLLILSVGKRLYKQVDTKEFLANFEQEKGWATWWAEITSTHPFLVKRIKALQSEESTTVNEKKPFVSPAIKVDHKQKGL